MVMYNNEQEKAKIITRITKKYHWISVEEINECYDIALKDYVSYRYPSANNRPQIKDVELDFMVSQWIKDRMIDILSRAGGLSLSAYRENGLSLNYGSSYIDPELKLQIMPKASVPR